MSVAFGPMTIFLISWVCASMVLCLGFLRAAARRVPCVNERLLTEGEADLRPETAVVLEEAGAPCPPLSCKRPAPPLQARPATTTPLLLPPFVDYRPTPREIVGLGKV